MAYTKLHTTWHNKESGILDSPEDANAWMHVEDGIYNAAAVADNALAVAAAAAAKSANLSDLSDLSAARTNLGTVSATDSRLSDPRTPTGGAGGSLAGNYPNPTLAASTIASFDVAGAATTSTSTHAAAADPHGDRAFATSRAAALALVLGG